jgi:hypothetical protein
MVRYERLVSIMSWDRLFLERQEAEIFGTLAMDIGHDGEAVDYAEKAHVLNGEIVRRARIGWDINTEKQVAKFDRSL